MQSSAATISDYLAEQSTERRAGLEALLAAVRQNIQPGFIETMRWGMISFEVPLDVSGPTYNGQPLNYIGLASQKNHFSVYLMPVYLNTDVETEFRSRWEGAGLKLDIGKACVRFTKIENADLASVGWAAGLMNPVEFVDACNAARTMKP